MLYIVFSYRLQLHSILIEVHRKECKNLYLIIFIFNLLLWQALQQSPDVLWPPFLLNILSVACQSLEVSFAFIMTLINLLKLMIEKSKTEKQSPRVYRHIIKYLLYIVDFLFFFFFLYFFKLLTTVVMLELFLRRRLYLHILGNVRYVRYVGLFLKLFLSPFYKVTQIKRVLSQQRLTISINYLFVRLIMYLFQLCCTCDNLIKLCLFFIFLIFFFRIILLLNFELELCYCLIVHISIQQVAIACLTHFLILIVLTCGQVLLIILMLSSRRCFQLFLYFIPFGHSKFDRVCYFTFRLFLIDRQPQQINLMLDISFQILMLFSIMLMPIPIIQEFEGKSRFSFFMLHLQLFINTVQFPKNQKMSINTINLKNIIKDSFLKQG